MLAPDGLRLVPAHLARRDGPRVLETPQPIDRRAYTYAEPRRRLIPRQALLFDRRDNALSKVHRIRSCHGRLAPKSSPILESETQHLEKPKSHSFDSAK